MKILCIVGEQGAGKSSLSKKISETVPNSIILHIDHIVAKVLDMQEVKDKIKSILGKDVFIGDDLNKRKLSEIVVQSKEIKEKLHNLTEVYIEKEIDNEIKKQYDLIILDWYLLTEKKYWKTCDMRVFITADYDVRKKRIIDRDNIEDTEYDIREKKLVDFSKYYNDFDYIVYNNCADLKKEATLIYNKLFNES